MMLRDRVGLVYDWDLWREVLYNTWYSWSPYDKGPNHLLMYNTLMMPRQGHKSGIDTPSDTGIDRALSI